MKALRLPIGMGAAMAAMLIWMIHTGSLRDAALGFVLAHVAAVAILFAIAFAGAFWAGMPLRKMLGRLHRPSGKHGFAMIGGMAGIAALTCAACVAGLIEMS